jgi:glyoxylase-like metal-dependent hydrolase (beta-lactamase superfamily II)/rhodanese-related sulfurtransferase
MSSMELDLFVTRGLGDTSYLLASGREAVLVDPQRDAWRFVEAAEKRGVRIVRVVETHVHNDYLSGALEVRAATGAEIVAPARGGYEFAHRPADEGDSVELGGYRLTAMATPGHTPEHLAWIVTALDGPAGGAASAHGDGGNGSGAASRAASSPAPLAAFTGGSLLVGSVGRTDLMGPALSAALTLDQQRSLQRLAELPDEVRILPTHGAGSFCSAGPVARGQTTTVGDERLGNATFAEIDDEPAAFRERLLGGLGRVPAYYAHMAALNRQGPRILGAYREPPELDPAAFAAKISAGTAIVDGRGRRSFAAGHLPGSINIELDDSFAAYVGWLVPFAAPVLLVLPEPLRETAEEATTQLLRIGYERVQGTLAGGVEAWQADDRELSSYEVTTMAEFNAEAAGAQGAGPSGETVLDVRQPIEWQDDGAIPGAQRIFVADLPARLAEIPAGERITVLCRSGARAAIAASLLDAAGRDVRLVARGGATSWAGAFEHPATDAVR